MNPHADPRDSCCVKNSDYQRLQCANRGRREEENNHRHARCKTPGMVKCESAQQVAAREENVGEEMKEQVNDALDVKHCRVAPRMLTIKD